MEFHQPTMQEKALILQKFNNPFAEGCDFAFGSLMLWHDYYRTAMAVVEDSIVCFSGLDEQGKESFAYSFPMTDGDPKPAIDSLIQDSIRRHYTLEFYSVTPRMRGYLEQHYSGAFSFTPDRDSYDYFYRTEDLIHLPGRKYHQKRNHVAQFRRKEWRYELITPQNASVCAALNQKWYESRGMAESESAVAENKLLQQALYRLEELEMVGGMLFREGEAVAFAVGEPMPNSIMVEHFEKALPGVPGAYAAICQQFAEHHAVGYEYVNREEDMGIEGLRRSKLSLHPAFLLEKFIARYHG